MTKSEICIVLRTSIDLIDRDSLEALHAHYKNWNRQDYALRLGRFPSQDTLLQRAHTTRAYAFLTRTACTSSERKASAKCILLSPGAVAPTYLRTALAWDINVMRVVKATRHEIRTPLLGRAIRVLRRLKIFATIENVPFWSSRKTQRRRK